MKGDVPESSVSLAFQHVFVAESQSTQDSVVLFLHAEVERRVVERSAEQELERQVVDPLGSLPRMADVGFVETSDELVSDAQSLHRRSNLESGIGRDAEKK